VQPTDLNGRLSINQIKLSKLSQSTLGIHPPNEFPGDIIFDSLNKSSILFKIQDEKVNFRSVDHNQDKLKSMLKGWIENKLGS
jgi:hypothetical protein